MAEMIESKDPCVDCKQTFMRIKQRGRPPIRCTECMSAYKLEKVQEQTAKTRARSVKDPNKVDNRPPQLRGEVKMWEGQDVVPTAQDLPKGNEAQCPLCMRIFTSDTLAEEHKPYTQPVTVHCKTPKKLGMVQIERRNLPIWTRLSTIESGEES